MSQTSSASNPLKRVAEGDFELGGIAAPIGEQISGSMNPRPCHGRLLTGRLSGSHDAVWASRDPPASDQKRHDWSAHQKIESNTPKPATIVKGTLVTQNNTSYKPAKAEEDCPLETEPPESQEAEPKMLLQSETRPISHEQLVGEVKGTVKL